MKFVKGDAIAGLIMTAVNIAGGICVGAFQKGWPIAKAIEKYAILTIGDGLVSQIPALLVSVTAGIIVTRVGDADNKPLGHPSQRMCCRWRSSCLHKCLLALSLWINRLMLT